MKQTAKSNQDKTRKPKSFAWSVATRQRPTQWDNATPRGCDCGCGCCKTDGRISRAVQKSG